MAYVDFVSKTHSGATRDYLERVSKGDKPECGLIAKQYGKDYWDGDRKYGYGGYHYDGRWRSVAQDMVEHYNLQPGASVLDVGCGKAYLLYEFSQVLPNVRLSGIDLSEYAIENAKEEVKPFLRVGNAVSLPYQDQSFDLVISVTTLHNLYVHELRSALQEIERVGKQHKYIVVESYRNEVEMVNMLNWQLTCRSFYSPEEWEWFMTDSGYTGDFSCQYFE